MKKNLWTPVDNGALCVSRLDRVDNGAERVRGIAMNIVHRTINTHDENESNTTQDRPTLGESPHNRLTSQR